MAWATRSVLAAIVRVVMLLAAVWHVVMVVATLISAGTRAWPLALVFLGIGMGAAGAGLAVRKPLLLRDAAAPGPGTGNHSWELALPFIMFASALAGFMVSGSLDSGLTLACCWQIDFASCLMGLLILSRWVILANALATTSVVVPLMLFLPQWGPSLTISIPITQLSIVVALSLGLPHLLSLSARADRDESASHDAIGEAELNRRVSLTVAEEARALHDTAINTLGAIANGGIATRDAAMVRTQCARDVEHLERLLKDRAPLGPADGAGLTLSELAATAPVSVVRTGLTDADIEALVSPAVDPLLQTMFAAVREALTNVGKHAGVDEAQLHSEFDEGRIVVTVTDKGRGFAFRGGTKRSGRWTWSGAEGEANESSPMFGRGLTESVLGRARDAGFEAEVTSERDVGTTVRFSLSTSRSETEADASQGNDVGRVLEAITRRASLLWAAGSSAISVVLTVAGGTNVGGALYVMLGVMVACWMGTRFWILPLPSRPTAHDGYRRIAGIALLGVAATLTFALSAAATGMGAVGPAHWQALAVTTPFTLFVMLRPGRGAMVTVVAIWVSTIVALTAWGARSSLDAALCVAVAGTVGLGFSWAWLEFLATLRALAAETAGAQRRAFRARVTRDAERAAQDSYQRWVDAGLQSAVALLRRVALGEASPTDIDVRRRCSEEEAYLRQLISVSPELVHLGPAIIPVLRAAREARVELVLRTGTQDTANIRDAEVLALLVERAVRSAGDVGISASIFPVGRKLQLTLLGPVDRQDITAWLPTGNPPPAGTTAFLMSDGPPGIIEIVLVPPPPSPSTPPSRLSFSVFS